MKISNYSVNELLSKANAIKNTAVTLETFKFIVGLYFKPLDLKQELVDCFKFFDKKEAGKINAEAFKLMLGEQGISQVEIDEFIADAKIDKKGEIDYMAYAKRVAEGEVEKKVEPKNKFSTKSKKWNSCKQFK